MPFALSLRTLAVTALLLTAGCDTRTELTAPPAELAQFRLGHAVVLADKAVQAPISRNATPEEWKAALEASVAERFGRLEGETLYHLGIHVDGFAVAPPGVPLVVSPKSVLIISVTLFANEAGGRKLHEKPKQLTVFENLSGDTVIGSGLTRTKEQQMRSLAFNAARAIEDWLIENPQFFDPSKTPKVSPEPPSARGG